MKQLENLPPEQRAGLAKQLLSGLDCKKLFLETWSQTWVDWVEQNVSDNLEDLDKPRSLSDEIHDIVAEQSILCRNQVQSLLERWFQDVPFLVLSNYDSLDNCSAADPNGGVLMHPIVAVTNGVIGIDNALAKGVWKDFEEFEEMDERWNDQRAV